MKTHQFDIITIFSEMFKSPFAESILKRAQDQGLLNINLHDLRKYTVDKHRKTDDYPFGGGVGLIMNVDPIVRAIEAVKETKPSARSILLSPRGKVFNQKMAWELSREENLIFVCGRYEGVDERVLNFIDDTISIGDYVMAGGEIPAMVLIESISRLIPNVIGDESSLLEESFESNRLEYPQFTRPREFRGLKVPEVLLSGHHKKIQDWQLKESLKKTKEIRPDLLSKKARQTD
ncbi:MAG: tRNA (guanosine(37)-N1)-methyltransferase TrmD [Nitrospina sp.]|nr:tRNA (guanosine(37)-N1)-methyltransferase TrmD [Nitrospina sp.]MBT6601022.1 tRNA (guanosine(37)-N1)-methyltransferase TrmD [Nitrospina sp.]